MSKIVEFKTKTDNVKFLLDEIKEEVDKNEIENMMIICKCKDGSVLQAHTSTLDYGDCLTLLSHAQINVIKGAIYNDLQ